MNKIVFLFSAMLLALVVLFGCSTQSTTPSNTTPFTLDSNVAVKEGITYFSSEQGLTLRVTDFTDSRCPQGVECIWAGEQGVDLQLYLEGDPSLLLGKVHLGETTARTASVNDGPNRNYEVELVSIDTDANSAILIVRQAQTPPASNEKDWFLIDPKQCKNNAWDKIPLNKFLTAQCSADPSCVEQVKVDDWLVQNQVIVYQYATKQVSEVVCDSCNCSRGDKIAVLVDSNKSTIMTSLDWTLIGNVNAIPCTLDAKVCPDGSAVGRTAPFCEFEACP